MKFFKVLFILKTITEMKEQGDLNVRPTKKLETFSTETIN